MHDGTWLYMCIGLNCASYSIFRIRLAHHARRRGTSKVVAPERAKQGENICRAS